MIRMLLPSLAGILTLAAAMQAGASEAMNQCHEVATRCMNAGNDAKQCQQQVDACMSDNACEEVYLSCLELMEVDEGMTDAACEKKKAACRRRYGQ